MLLQDWLGAFRLRTVPLSIAGIFLATCLVGAQQQLDLLLVIFSFISVMLLQVLSNLANDYGDAIKGTDQYRLLKDRKVSTGKISAQKMKTAIYIVALMALVSSSLSIFISFHWDINALLYGGLVALSVWAAIAYTVGKKPYGYRAMGDIFVFIFFGLMSVCGGYFLLAHRWDPWIIFPAASIGFLSAAVLNINNVRDLETDRKSGKRTIPGIIGATWSRRYQVVLITLAFLCALVYKLYYFKGVGQLIFLLLLFPFIKHIIRFYDLKDSLKINSELPKVSKLTFHFSLLFGLGEQEWVAYYL